MSSSVLVEGEGEGKERLNLRSETQGQCLVLITARAGSKGLPGKNIAPLCGKPLIAHVIAAAKKAKCVGRVVVSTDGHDIAEVSRRHGAEVPFMRPGELATDTAPHIGSLKHALETLALDDPPYRPKWIVLLQPTSPFTTAGDIDAAMQLAVDRDARSVVSVCKAQQHPFKMFCADETGALETLEIANASFPKTVEYLRRQDVPEVGTYLSDLDALHWYRSFQIQGSGSNSMWRRQTSSSDGQVCL